MTISNVAIVRNGAPSQVVGTAPFGVGYTYLATSASSVTISNSGSKAFTVAAGLAYTVGARIRAYSRSSGAWVEGVVSDYTATTLTMDADFCKGTGTYTDWNINIAGAPGEPTLGVDGGTF